MSEMLDHAAYLSETIGPRPAGTEEERQAALYVAETLQRKAGLPTQVEDFTCPIDFDLPRAILCGISVALTVLSIVFSILVVPAFIVALVCAALYCVEVLWKPVIARAISHGASQNVVARYEPNEYAESTATRHRKVILLSHYDSGKVRRELSGGMVGALPIVYWAEAGAMVLLALLLLIRLIFIPTGTFSVVVNVLSIIALLVALLPLVGTIMRRMAPYNEGANCNASGVAVMMEVARRLREGRNKALAEQEEPVSVGARIHGAAAARQAGLVPEGADLVYEADATDDDEASAEDRLMAAKAAVAMLTGKPVSASVNIDLDEAEDEAVDGAVDAAQNAAYVASALEGAEVPADNPRAALSASIPLVEESYAGENSTDQAPVTFVPKSAQAASSQAAAATAVGAEPELAAAAPTMAFTAEQEPSVPDWFTAARAKAKRNGADLEDGAPVQRSRYAEAAEMAQREIDARMEAERAAAEAETTPTDTEARLQEMRAAIIENYPTSSEAAAAAAKKAAESGAAADANAESATTAFAPVMIDGDQLKAEAAAAADAPGTRQVVVQGSSETTGELPPVAAAQAAGAAPAVAESQAVKLQSLIPQLAIPREKPSEEQQARQASLRSVLPSLSGSIKAPDVTAEEPDENAEREQALDSLSDSFSPVTATAVFSAVEADEYEELGEEFADDVDETGFETGPATSTGLVEMPKSRAGRLFGKFRKNKKSASLETSAHEWLDVDDDFDARAVGEARGGWESFRRDEDADDFDDGYDEFEETGFRPRGWNGGAFSRLARRSAQAEGEMDAPEAEPNAFAADLSQPLPIVDEAQAIRDFHEPNIEIEVWFVALGAELSGNGGIDAFLAEHRDELKGAVFIDAEALGAGDLSLIEEEGMYFPVKASSRMERYSRKAAASCGLSLGRAKMLWRNSAAAAVLRHGSQAMHLAGMDGLKPAFGAQRNDQMANIDDATLNRNADFLVELLRSI